MGWTEADLRKLGHKAPTNHKAIGRVKQPGAMNRTEAAYAQHLDAKVMVGEIQSYWFEAITLKLAHDVRLTVDFFILTKDLELHAVDTKGAKKFTRKSGAVAVKARIEEDARIKLACAAAMFPFRFFTAHFSNGNWVEREISAA